jgi:hypothetical protein
VEDSGGGSAYHSENDFETVLNQLLSSAQLRDQLGVTGREYVLAHYASERVVDKFLRAIGLNN